MKSHNSLRDRRVHAHGYTKSLYATGGLREAWDDDEQPRSERVYRGTSKSASKWSPPKADDPDECLTAEEFLSRRGM